MVGGGGLADSWSGPESALRWEGTLRVQDASVYFRQSKSNYSRPMPESMELELTRGPSGVVRVVTASEREDQASETQAKAQAKSKSALDRDVTRIVEALERYGEARSKAQVIAWAGLGTGPGRLALAESVTRGLVSEKGPLRDRRFVRSACVTSPHTPQESESSMGSGLPGGVSADLSPRESARVRESATVPDAAE